ncbi:MAG: hypothetical protein DMF63_11715 [Acidobacteria bacterium]|nr:MAG: hypothetical protein DMF63_11715 [Acidobacteriota bacterium]
MANAKKRPSKTAKAAKKLLESSKLLAEKNERDMQSGQEFKASEVTPRTNSTAMKARPHKKRG